MKAFYLEPEMGGEVIDVVTVSEVLRGEVEYFWPFENDAICLAVLADREELAPNRILNGVGVIKGPMLFFKYDDYIGELTENEITYIESFIDWAVPEQINYEDYNDVHVVTEDEFYESLRSEREDEEECGGNL